MKQITFARTPINMTLLHQEMEAALGKDRFFSISIHPDIGIIFQVAEDVTRQEIIAVAQQHNPNAKTEEETARDEAIERLDWFVKQFDVQAVRAEIDTNGVTPEVGHAILDALGALVKVLRVM